jgi:hypothetical protein
MQTSLDLQSPQLLDVGCWQEFEPDVVCVQDPWIETDRLEGSFPILLKDVP